MVLPLSTFVAQYFCIVLQSFHSTRLYYWKKIPKHEQGQKFPSKLCSTLEISFKFPVHINFQVL